MPAFNASQVKMALCAAKDISAADEVRRKYSTRDHADFSSLLQMRGNQRNIDNFVNSWLTKTGFESGKFHEILVQNQTELRGILEEQKANAVEQSPSVKEILHLDVDSRRKTVEHLITLAPPPKYELLSSPFLIWPTQGLLGPSAHVEPFNSSIKVKLNSERQSGSEKLSFYFLWENPDDTPAIINANGYLVLNGFCSVLVLGKIFSDTKPDSALGITVSLSPSEWWNQPPTQPLLQEGQQQSALYLWAQTGSILSSGASDSEFIYKGYDLRHTLHMIPPHGVVVFEVCSYFSYRTTGGLIEADFRSGDFEILCPGVLVTILT
jgi:hypothetical protein